MFVNYLKVTLRNLVKNRTYSLINIFGLLMGFTCCLLIMLYVKQELSYDRFHAKANRIYRVGVEAKRTQGLILRANTSAPMGPALKADYPEIEKFTRLYYSPERLVEHGDKAFFEYKFTFADPDFFTVFSFPLIKGSLYNFSDDPHSIVLTSSMAKKYFGDEEPLGKVLTYNKKYNFKVVAIIEDVPLQSHFHFDFVASFQILNADITGFTLDQWGIFPLMYTYVILPPQLDVEDFTQKIKPFVNTHYQEPGTTYELFFQPLKDIHLRSHLNSEIEVNNHASNLLILITIALSILCIAVINYINLATAQSFKRAKEVGMRKVLGAARFQLLKQFMGESVIFSILAIIFSLFFIELLLPIFSAIVGKPVGFALKENLLFLFIIFLLTLAVGVVSSVYPAFVLSGFQPIRALKESKYQGRTTFGQVFLKKGLVVMQFAISIVLITGTLVITQQLGFLKSANMGFNKDQMIVVTFTDRSLNDRYETMKNELSLHPHVVSSTACYKAPIAEHSVSVSIHPDGKEGEAKFLSEFIPVDHDFVDTFGLEIIAGRQFSREFPSDFEKAFILNETIVRKLGYSSPDEALGRKLLLGINDIEGTIIGVVKDFHFASLHEDIKPLILMHRPGWFTCMVIKIRPDDVSGTLAFLEKTWAKFAPGYPFQYSFLDEDVNKLYQAEGQTSIIIRVFSIIAIVIACLGLYGLVAFTVVKRTKEIGIRKVLGASIPSIMGLLSRGFTKWVLLANIFAWPIAYYAMNKWLQNFAYRTKIEPWIFVLSGVLALVIALLAVSYQSIKAAVANPIDSLRYE